MLDDLIRGAREDFDLTNPEHQQSVTALAEALLAQAEPTADVLAAAGAADAPLEARMAGLLANSRDWLQNNAGRELKVAVVLAMWGEQNRLKPKSDDNPTGEDSLHTKLNQLDWLFADTQVDWTLVPVDDGDPAVRGRRIGLVRAHGDRPSPLPGGAGHLSLIQIHLGRGQTLR